jgi:hypothetical protein
MRINFEIEPLSIRISSNDGYGLSILGYAFNRIHRAIGFNIYSEKHQDCKKWMIVFYIYKFIRRKTLRTINDSYKLVCNECGNLVWKHNLYCQYCDEEVSYSDVTRIPLEES